MPIFYYIYPFGLRFEEVTTENLLKVSLDGQNLEGEEYQYNKTGYFIHGSIYKTHLIFLPFFIIILLQLLPFLL